MGRSEDLARDQEESVFIVNARFAAFSRYDYDLDRSERFVEGARWAATQPLSASEVESLASWLGDRGVPADERETLARGLFDRLRCIRIDPPSAGTR